MGVGISKEKSTLVQLRTNIENLLEDSARDQFRNLTSLITQFGFHQPENTVRDHKMLRCIVSQNAQILECYNHYARLQATEESRLPHQLPIFLDVETSKSNNVSSDSDTAQDLADGRQKTASLTVARNEQTQEKERSQIRDEGREEHKGKGADEERTDAGEDAITDQAEADIPNRSSGGGYTSVISVLNPEDFPIHRIQDIQAQRYPSAKVVSMWAHQHPNGTIIEVTANMMDGPVNHLSINDHRLILALGLCNNNSEIIKVDEAILRADETFTIRIPPGQRPRNVNNFVIGVLHPARHAYLYWLDYRNEADPKQPPFVQEAIMIAPRIGRRAPDVWKEIDGFWNLEQGPGGKMYRQNRMKFLGEDPVYAQRVERAGKEVTMWG